MRVALGTTVLNRGLASGGVDGIGKYTQELQTRLQAISDIELTCYSHGFINQTLTDTRCVDAGSFQTQALISLPTRAPFFRMSRQLGGAADLVHAPDHLIPCLRHVPTIATVMDAIPLSHPEWVGYRFRRAKNWAWKQSVNWADHIITISEFSKAELSKWFELPEERVTAIPLGVDGRWFEQPAPEEQKAVVQKYNLPKTYFVVVGTLQPRKNLLRVMQAHQQLPDNFQREVPLVVVGRPGWACEAEMEMLTSTDSMQWLSYVPESDLVPLVAGAKAMVFASLYEGFGLPVLEAFAAGVPVIASNSTSLPEVAGSAALLVDPHEVDQISNAMCRLLEDAPLCESLRLQGLNRASQFSWERTAQATIDVYRKFVEERA